MEFSWGGRGPHVWTPWSAAGAFCWDFCFCFVRLGAVVRSGGAVGVSRRPNPPRPSSAKASCPNNRGVSQTKLIFAISFQFIAASRNQSVEALRFHQPSPCNEKSARAQQLIAFRRSGERQINNATIVKAANVAPGDRGSNFDC